MNIQEFHQSRQFAEISYGRIAYVELGGTTIERDDAARAGVLADQFIAAQLANKAMARGPDGLGG